MKNLLGITMLIIGLFTCTGLADATNIPDGPTCPADAPCYYSGPAHALTTDRRDLNSNHDVRIKVVRGSDGNMIAIITASTGGRLDGESGYVYSDNFRCSHGRDFTHYFTVDGLRYYFKM